MRIISGHLKSRRITAPKNLPVRPTTDLSKESLFNILNNHFNLSQVKVLDLFSGTGNISYEFGSRGSENITAVDADFKCTKFINETAKTFDLQINVIKSDVFKYLENCKNQSYDIIFADPPYDLSDEQFQLLTILVKQNNLLNEDGFLIIEHSKHTTFQNLEQLSFQKKYGSSMFSFFK